MKSVAARTHRPDHIERIDEISRRAIVKVLRRLWKRQLIRSVKSITTDNGCDGFYTRACASCEKGSVENCNRLVRRWHPKGTDFVLCTRRDIARLETTINSIHRLSLGVVTHHACNSPATLNSDEQNRILMALVSHSW